MLELNTTIYLQEVIIEKQDLHHGWANAAGAILCSTTDLNKFNQCLFKGKLLDTNQLTKMLAPTFKGEIPSANAMGIGWFLVIDENNAIDYVFHGGNTLGYSCVLIHFPKKDLTIVTAMNLFPEGKNNPVEEIQNGIINEIVKYYE